MIITGSCEILLVRLWVRHLWAPQQLLSVLTQLRIEDGGQREHVGLRWNMGLDLVSPTS